MCLAIPGKVVKIEKGNIEIDYGKEKRTADSSIIEIKEGDYVIVNNKIVVNKLSKEEAERFLELIR